MRFDRLAGLVLVAVWLAAAPPVRANALGDAWQCAKGSAQAGYELAGKGADALQVLGSAPQCVAYATGGDVPLYVTTGALFGLNAIDSSLVSADHCVASVQSNAAVPFGRLIDGAMPGVIPQDLLKSGTEEAGAQLWDAMAGAPPPVSTAIQRVDCGCKFLEAGISVQNLVEIYTVIAQAGEKCDAALGNLPGYQAVKKGVKAGASAINNLGEDIFTDQVQHKDVEAYYFEDFGGGTDSWVELSHAAARVLDPAHDWRTQEGASFNSQTNVRLGGGVGSGQQFKDACVTYFDNHKMSNDNANEVCEILVQRFDAEYRTLVPRMKAQDQMMKSLETKLASLQKQAIAQCEARFPKGPGTQLYGTGDGYSLYTGFGPNDGAHNQCVTRVANADGYFEWRNPYAVVGSLGTPVDPAKIDAQLATGKTFYFQPPLNSTGARRAAWQAFQSNGGNAGGAVTQGVLAYEIARDRALAEAQAYFDKLTLLEKQQRAAEVKGAAGFAFSSCPTGANYQACVDALGDAVDVCVAQMDTVPFYGEFPKPEEQKKIDAVQAQCKLGYLALAQALGKRNGQAITLGAQLANQCPAAGHALRAVCLDDAKRAVASCQGGAPHMTSGWFDSKRFAQDPPPQMDCDAAASLFSGKWGADDAAIGVVNQAQPPALQACNQKTAQSSECQEQVSKLADGCRTDLRQTANVLLGSLPLGAPELAPGQASLMATAKQCAAQMAAIPAKMAEGHEAEALMLQQYQSSCRRIPACVEELRAALAQCEGKAPAPAPAQRTQATLALQSSLGKRRAQVDKSSVPLGVVLGRPQVFSAVGVSATAPTDQPALVVAACKGPLSAVIAKYADQPLGGAAPAAQRPGIGDRPAATLRPVQTVTPAGPILRAAPRASASSAPTLEPGTDRMGRDYRGFGLDQPDPQLCRQACAGDSRCQAYTFVRAGVQGPQAMCYLKDAVPPARSDGCCTSGVKPGAGKP
jgi:hypothetical protein